MGLNKREFFLFLEFSCGAFVIVLRLLQICLRGVCTDNEV